MGQKNNVMNHYFRNKKRFADLFNGVQTALPRCTRYVYTMVRMNGMAQEV